MRAADFVARGWALFRMRICHVIESASGGSSRVVVDLLRDQVAAGHDVTLIYSPVRAEAPFTDAVAAMGDVLRVRRLRMRRAVGVHDVIACVELFRALRSLGPFDVIHGHSSKAGALTRIAGLFLPGAVIVYTPHAFITLSPDASAVYGAIEWAASWFCDAILLGSEQEFVHARERLHLPAARLRLLPMGADLAYPSDRAGTRRALGLLAEDFAVGFVGRLSPQKNPLRLARVFHLAARARPDLRFVIVGDGDMREALTGALDALGVARATILAPQLDGRDAMPAFDCLVCTSDYEPFGLVFVEALAAGVPIVSPPVGVAPIAIVGGETGVLTSFEPQDIARGVVEIAAMTEAARGAMAQACRERARLFDIRQTTAETRRVYEELLARKAGARR